MNYKILLPLLVVLIVLPSALSIKVQQIPLDFFVEASLGSLDNYSTFIKRGHNADIDIADGDDDLWEQGGPLQYLNTSEVINFTSTDNDDKAGGTGGQLLVINGLDNDYVQQIELLRLNGTTIVQTVKKYLRINQVLVRDSGQSEVNEGTITGTTNRTDLIQIVIDAGEVLDQNSQFTVPAGKRALILKVELNAAKLGGGQNPELEFKAFTRLRKSFPNASWVQLFDKKLDTSVTDEIDITQVVSGDFPAGTDFRVTASTDKDNTEARSRMYILLFDDSISLVEEDTTMPIAIMLTVIFVISIYFFVLIRLFSEREFTQHGLVKLLFYMVAFWILLLPVNMAIQFNDANAGPSVVTDHLELLYLIMIWLNWFITFYFFIWFLVQMIKKIGPDKGREIFT